MKLYNNGEKEGEEAKRTQYKVSAKICSFRIKVPTQYIRTQKTEEEEEEGKK